MFTLTYMCAWKLDGGYAAGEGVLQRGKMQLHKGEARAGGGDLEALADILWNARAPTPWQARQVLLHQGPR